jgi:hypothetical protein
MTWEGSEGRGMFWRSYRCSSCGIVGRQNLNVVRQQVSPGTELVRFTDHGYIHPSIEELLDGTNLGEVENDSLYAVVKSCRIDFEVEYGPDHSLTLLLVAGAGRLGWVASTGVASC